MKDEDSLQRSVLDHGFCPADESLRIWYSFHALKIYSLFQAESQVACYAYANVISLNV